MRKARRNLTARVVPLRSREASDATVHGTITERLALVTRLSEAGWSLTGQPLPQYTRATMPVVVTSLKARTEPA